MARFKTNSSYRTSAKRILSLQGELAIFEDPAGSPYEETIRNYVGLDFVCGILVDSGSVAWHMGNISSTAISRCVVIMGTAGAEDISFSNDFRGFLVGMAQGFVKRLSVDYSFSGISTQINNGPVRMVLDGEQHKLCGRYLHLLSDNLDHGREDVRMDSSIHVSTALMYQMLGTPDTFFHSDGHTRKEIITKEFLKMVKVHGHQQRKLKFYAQALCVTPKYLSSSVTGTTRKTTRKWMDDITMNKARFYLRTSSRTVAQISDLLNFPSPADFGRFFLKHEGITPMKYRVRSA